MINMYTKFEVRSNPHTKFEVSTITCNEEIKGDAKCKYSRLERPFGRLRGNAQGSSMAEICQNRRFPKRRVTLSQNFR